MPPIGAPRRVAAFSIRSAGSMWLWRRIACQSTPV
jgi:hypothetical protein